MKKQITIDFRMIDPEIPLTQTEIENLLDSIHTAVHRAVEHSTEKAIVTFTMKQVQHIS